MIQKNRISDSQAYWKRLIQRYFEAETTEQEEQKLMRWLATPHAVGEEADEARAVMGVFVVTRPSRKRSTRRGLLPWAIAAAIAGLVFFISTQLWTQKRVEPATTDICIACVDGKTTTVPSEVMAAVHRSWNDIDYGGAALVESELTDLFSTLQ